VRNKLTVALKATLTETAQQYTELAVLTLLEVMTHPKATPSARASCAMAILDRGHGRPAQAIDLGNKDDKPFRVRDGMSELEIARRLALLLAAAAKQKE
jgi:hypothetical protein